MPTNSTVIVVAGGPPPSPLATRGLPDNSYVIAADSGLDHALKLGLRVDLVVGDMDSVLPETLAQAEQHGTTIRRHPPAKDQTDLELALEHAYERSPEQVIVVGGAGGRLDHELSGLLMLASPRWAAAPLEARIGDARSNVIRDTLTVNGTPGDLISLVPVAGAALGVTTRGLVYPLDDEDLDAGTCRGVSNELARPTATVRLRSGTLLAIRP